MSRSFASEMRRGKGAGESDVKDMLLIFNELSGWLLMWLEIYDFV